MRQTETVHGAPVRVLRAIGCDVARDAARVFVIGDSHAIGHFALLHALVASAGHEVRIQFRAGCPFPPLGGEAAATSSVCDAFAQAAWADVAAHARTGDVLLLSSLRLPRLSELQGGGEAAASRPAPPPGAAADIQESERAAVERLTPFAARGLHIVFEAPKPVLPAPAFRCVDWFNRAHPVCDGGLSRPRAEVEAERAASLEMMRRIASRLPAVSVWDPLPVLCPDDACVPSLRRHLDALAVGAQNPSDHVPRAGEGARLRAGRDAPPAPHP
jgi:hypothetical protein